MDSELVVWPDQIYLVGGLVLSNTESLQVNPYLITRKCKYVPSFDNEYGMEENKEVAYETKVPNITSGT